MIRHATTALILTVLSLCALGALMVFSVCTVHTGGMWTFVKHLIAMGVGLALFTWLLHRDYHKLGEPRVFLGMIVVSVALLALVLLVGKVTDGATRWIKIAGFSLQPSELARVALIVFLAVKLTQYQNRVRNFVMGCFFPMVTAFVFSLPVVAQRDAGIPFMMLLTAGVMVFVAGARWSHLAGAAAVGAGFIYALVKFAPHRLERVMVFLDPWSHREDGGWQLIQSMSAFAQGGMFGKGPGAGEQKLGYLPADHTDFIFAMIGEELGFVGTLLTVLAFLVLAWAMLRIALNAPDMFGTMLATGFCVMICAQAYFIIAVNLCLLPTKGLPLPFVSYGGTSIMVCLAAAGIVANIGSQAAAAQGVQTPSVHTAPLRGGPMQAGA
ncbi:MAG TPA: putative peptidoglycan glycosyltransferase FtsW [Candidatus Hydrogenedentes bacterium]|nr:putative peptidoglycan glycosyltransferase FtsW [Candidatus Hydrogenedentota bacterium]HOH50595.1 putative peptidoglycan glycosyltransferase FtsW [Candidatus Hydrogenedentota bacterium]HPA40434.1 putative peptidoglycan glycosyltransferase FtsW [Candidatus Hydrogenedentota bacterium]HQL94178.1 putative peptidoglycan glycosyltransferase FtsW [Candidatus Hydrogenedentota bacterium]